jgi:hypothetical protein
MELTELINKVIEYAPNYIVMIWIIWVQSGIIRDQLAFMEDVIRHGQNMPDGGGGD